MKQAILLKAALWDDLAKERYNQLVENLHSHDGYEVSLLLDAGENDDHEFPDNINGMLFHRSDLLDLVKDREYCAKASHGVDNPKTSAALSILPVLLYVTKNPNFDRYWMVEEDVYFSGDWYDFFENYKDSKSHLISTHIRKDSHHPFTNTVKFENAFEHMDRTFYYGINCICGLSNKLTQSLLQGYKEGMFGHFECVLPMRCVQEFGEDSIEDISCGDYVKPENKNKFYHEKMNRSLDDGLIVGYPVPVWFHIRPNQLYHAIKHCMNGRYDGEVGKCENDRDLNYSRIMNYLISIVITAYNVENTITKAVESALSQTWDNIEVIVVEDCSTDSTLSILESIENPKLKLIKNPENLGAGMSRRIGIENASGEYVMTLDGDDYLENDFIESLLKDGEDADVISGGVSVVYRDGTIKHYMCNNHKTEGVNKINGFFEEEIKFINNKLIKRYLYIKYPYNTRRYVEDTPSIIPILYDANMVKYVDNDGYYYCLRDESLTAKANVVKNSVFNALCLRDIIEFFKDKPRGYRDLFRLFSILQEGKRIKNRPREEIMEFVEEFPNEWKEFLDYLAHVEELKFSLAPVE